MQAKGKMSQTLLGIIIITFLTGNWGTSDKTDNVLGARREEFLLSSTITFLSVKAWPNGSNMLVQHHPTLLNTMLFI